MTITSLVCGKEAVKIAVTEKQISVLQTIQRALDPQLNSGSDEVPVCLVEPWAMEFVLEFVDYDLHLRASLNKTEQQKWETHFFGTRVGSHDKAIQVFSAAHFLDYPLMMKSFGQYVKRCIQGKTPDEIRQEFGITVDWSEEEKAKIKEEEEYLRQFSLLAAQ